MNPGTERRFSHNFSQGSSGKNWQQDFAGRTKQEGERSDVHPNALVLFRLGCIKEAKYFISGFLGVCQNSPFLFFMLANI